MRVALIGGVYGKDAAYRARVTVTPETMLEAGLKSLGHDVSVLSHRFQGPLDDFDIVHVHHLGRGSMRVALDRSRAKFVYTQHQSTQWTMLRRVAVWHTMRCADAVVALAQPLASIERRRYPVPAHHVVIPNGVPTPIVSWAVRQPPVRGDPWRLLFAGQLAPFKGVDSLIRAVALLSSPQQLRLRLAYHNSAREAELRSLTRQLGLDHVIEFLGPLSQDGLWELMADSHALVLPSIGAEALPGVITEAMMLGLPVVASDVGAIADQLHEFGILVPAGDAESLAGAVAHLTRDYAHWAARAAASSDYAIQRFSPASMASAHEKLYASICDSHAPRRTAGAVRSMNVPVRIGVRLVERVEEAIGVNLAAKT